MAVANGQDANGVVVRFKGEVFACFDELPEGLRRLYSCSLQKSCCSCSERQSGKGLGMVKPRKHHFVPRFYLAGFCPADSEMLAIYDRVRNQFRTQRPSEVAHRRDYYAYEDDQGNKSFDIEDGLGQVETAASAVIQKIDAGQEISEDDRETLAIYVGYQYTRTPVFQHMFDSLYSQRTTKISKAGGAEDIDAVKAALEQAGVPPGMLGQAAVVDFAKALNVEPDRVLSLGAMLRLAPRFAFVFKQMNWTVWRCQSEKTSFVTTDNPFCMVPTKPLDGGVYKGAGMMSADTVNILPLSKSSCLALSVIGKPFAYRPLENDVVRRVNLSVTVRCQEFVFARDMALVQSLVNATHIDKKPWQSPLRTE